MSRTASRSDISSRASRGLVAIVCAALLAPGEAVLFAQAPPPAATPPAAEAEPKLPPEQLDALVAPIALYPDELLGQVLVASTYPLEIVQLQQWLAKNKGLKDKALTDAVAKQPWDPSIQGMAALPDVVKRLGDDIQWTTELGNAFLAQQSDVMDAVQRMRKKAEGTGALKTNEQQKVETKVIEQKQVIVVQQANPEVVYVPSYNPVVVYGPPVYAYPPIYYPPPPPPGSVFAASMISFGVGMMVGAAFHGGWGYGCGWGHNDINVNVNNNYNRNANINRNTNVNRSGNTSWNHNPQHRGAAPYANQTTANKYGGTARGGQASARTQGTQATRAGGAGVSAQSAGSGARSGTAATDRSGARSASPSASAQSSRGSGSGGGGGERIGSRDVSRTGSGGSSALGGGSHGYSGQSARANSSRGASSAGSRGGGSRGGGGRRR
jgi:Protein of unknown function (DUF3300)